MNILDIDLDFFLYERAIGDDVADTGKRLDDSKYPVWSKQDVLEFLSINCGVNKDSRTPISLIEDHDEVFIHVLQNGFSDINLYHIDAHHDLYPAESPWYYNEYSHKNLLDRESLPYQISPIWNKRYLNEGNYIGFLLSCEKLLSVTFITDVTKGWGDKPCRMFCKDFDERIGILQLPRLIDPTNPFTGTENPYDKKDRIDFCGKEVPFQIIDYHDFSSEGVHFDYAFLSKSPRYTPASADALIPEILNLFNKE